ncbi:hypothetical protein AOQ84DRAFT_373314 [Glonium stellatum]|uniref:F-box domain-containing protein n=1 Tax=Glonium stellatum TaxID=574774 RepID=A0A8E2F7V7_9PEZI|nr:hypothetical protein AOQ84DRAFT_373314 [Glonium stellatum]
MDVRGLLNPPSRTGSSALRAQNTPNPDLVVSSNTHGAGYSLSLRPSINTLNNDILLEILDWINSTSPSTLLRTALVSKRWHSFSQRLLDRSLNITISQTREGLNSGVFRRLQTDSRFAQRVKELRVLAWHDYVVHFDAPWTNIESIPFEIAPTCLAQFYKLLEVLPKLNLLKFSWKARRLPTELADVLERLDPNIEISLCAEIDPYTKYRTHSALGPQLERRPQLISLMPKESQLVHLEVTIWIKPPQTFKSLEQFLPCCSKLKVLIIRNAISRSVRVAHCPRSIRGTRSNTTKLRLREISLHNVCLCDTHRCKNPEAGDRVDHWTNLVDWSSVKKATFSCLDFLVSFGESLTGLHALNLELFSSSSRNFNRILSCRSPLAAEAIKRFLSITHNLRDLELTNHTGILDQKLIMHLGKKLQNLRLHENSTFGVPRRVLKDSEIAFIGQNCPNLEGLAIDVIGEDLWPQETFKTIADSFPKIRRLEINIDVEPRGPGAPQPLPTTEYCQQLWRRYRSWCCKFNGVDLFDTSQLTVLDVSTGPQFPEGLIIYGDIPMPMDREIRVTKFRVSLSERDDEARFGTAHARNLEIDRLLKARREVLNISSQATLAAQMDRSRPAMTQGG